MKFSLSAFVVLLVAALAVESAYAYRGDSSSIDALEKLYIAQDGNLAYFYNWTQSVSPHASCSANRVLGGEYCLTSFGYCNPNLNFTVQTFSLETNQLVPSIDNGNQPSLFYPGCQENVFNVAWWCRKHHRTQIRWILETPVIDDSLAHLRSVSAYVEVDRKLDNCPSAFVQTTIDNGNFYWAGDPDS